MKQSRKWWLAWVFMMTLGWSIRFLALDVLPLFIDEAVLVGWSSSVLQGNPLAFGSEGRYLTPWVTALFTPQQASVWVIRAVSLLSTMVGWSTLVALTRRLGGRRAALWSLSLAIFFPVLAWHERIAVADNTLSVMILIWIWFLIRAWEAPNFKPVMHIEAGLIFILSFITKSSALLLTPLPICVAIILGRWPWRMRWQALAWHYSVVSALCLPFLIFLRWRGVDFLGRATYGMASDFFNFDRIIQQASFFVEHWLGYWHWWLSLIALVFVILAWHVDCRRVAVLSLASVAWIAAHLLIGDFLYFRYFLPAFFPFLGVVGLGLEVITRQSKLLAVISSTVLIGFGALFIQQAAFNLEDLPLPHLDRLQYLTADSSGMAVPSTAERWLRLAKPEARLLGLLPQCEALRLYLTVQDRQRLTCPNLLSDSARPRDFGLLLAEADWLVVEQPYPLRLPNAWEHNWELVAVEYRPGEKSGLALYRRLVVS
ncbi:MAG: glycosyltransferase family 39 protein [Anaerolineae bacterium]|nr:glycosyltransferase family 39 protein [Anaerolineae bacterium]MDW8171157.1 glycosyltransferase family 39 protein [Anaerolineae bacterium]